MRHLTHNEINKYRKKYLISKTIVIIATLLLFFIVVTTATLLPIIAYNNQNNSIPVVKKNIQLSEEEIIVKQNESQKLNIENYKKLRNINIEVENNAIASISNNTKVSDNGVIEIKGLNLGNTKLTITADNANLKTINIVCGKLKKDDVLLMTDNFVVTSDATYSSNSPSIILGNGGLNGIIKDDIIGTTQNWGNYSDEYSEYILATKKGVFNSRNQQLLGYDSLVTTLKEKFLSASSVLITTEGIFSVDLSDPKLPTGNLLDNLKHEDFWDASWDLLATSKGAFVLGLSRDPNNATVPIGPQTLTKENFIKISSPFLFTTEGIYSAKMSSTTTPIPKTNGITNDDIWYVNDQFVITSKGSFDKFGNVVFQSFFPDNSLTKDIILDVTSNYIVTTKGVYSLYGYEIGQDFLRNLNHETLIKAGEYGIITTKGIFLNNFDSINPNGVFIDMPLTKDEVIGVSNSLLVTTKGIFNYKFASTPSMSQILNNILPNPIREQIIAVSDSFLATTSGIFYYRGRQLIPAV